MILILYFLTTYLLSSIIAFPLPAGAGATSSLQATAQRISQGAKQAGSRIKQKLKEELEDLQSEAPPSLEERPRFPDLEPANLPETSILEHINPDSPPKCPIPLSPIFTAQFPDGQGHGCKKIAEKFSNANSFDQYYCQPLKAQAGGLCGDGFDAQVADCIECLVSEGWREGSLRRLEQYRGLCARV